MSVTTLQPLKGRELSLPVEVLEMVLAQLPYTFLTTTCTTVCKHWRDVIINPAFLPWKKLYHRYKLAPLTPYPTVLLCHDAGENLTAEAVVQRLCHQHSIDSILSCLVNIIRAVGHVHKAPQGSMAGLLESHPLYYMAQKTLVTLSQPSAEPEPLPHPPTIWHLAATIVVLSPDVWNIHSLISMMLRPGSLFSPCQVVEGFYSMALFFLHSTYTDTIKLPTRYHYMLFYALYLYENDWSGAPSDQPPARVQQGPSWLGQGSGTRQQSKEQFVQSTSSFKHTHEQLRIISHNLQPDHVVKVIAFAGTGKTTTLLHLCKRRPDQCFLLVVYNKSIQEHCARIFPHNTTVKTAHAMAYAAVGRKYAAVRRFTSNLTASSIAYFVKQRDKAGNRFRRAALVKNTLERYLNSADEHLTLQHVPRSDRKNQPIDDDYRLRVLLADAEDVWEEMKRCTNTQALPMTQEGQLKLWQLSRPKLLGYDVLMVDEGQDMNPPMLAVFNDQPFAKVIVGDPYQQIYSFRGAINALESVSSTHTFFLTQSFRFGPEVSYVAHCILESLTGARGQTLVGGNRHDSIVRTPSDVEAVQSKTVLRKAYLGRKNIEVYIAALALCQRNENRHLRMAFAGGIDKYGLDTIMDIYWLAVDQKEKIRNKFITRFSSVQSLMAFAEEVEDHELYSKIQMYNHSHANTQHHIQLLRERCSSSEDVADITFSTVHKAKGLEWDYVVLLGGAELAEDLRLLSGTSTSLRMHRDEMNILYVAVTRAKMLLSINQPVLHVLRFSRDRMEVLAPGIKAAHKSCIMCNANTDGTATLATKVHSLMVSEQTFLHGGYLCTACSADPQRSLIHLPSKGTVAFCLDPRKFGEYSRNARHVLFTGQVPQLQRV